MASFLYDSHGAWIAFRRSDGHYLFNKAGKWIGWFPWGDQDAVDTKGSYLGSVVADRLLKRAGYVYRGYPGYPGYPGYAGYFGMPSGYSDVHQAALAG
jgi:fermentation-respiration switch protein FrsA (DUF1100 family)